MAYYTTTNNVRDEAGFTNNATITDTQIDEHIDKAHAQILGMVGGVYNITNLDTSNADFDGSQAHDYLAQVERLMAAGYLLWKSYGIQGQDTDSDGNQKVEEARELLKMLYTQPNIAPTRLFDNNGDEFARKTYGTSGLPRITETRDAIFDLDDPII